MLGYTQEEYAAMDAAKEAQRAAALACDQSLIRSATVDVDLVQSCSLDWRKVFLLPSRPFGFGGLGGIVPAYGVSLLAWGAVAYVLFGTGGKR